MRITLPVAVALALLWAPVSAQTVSDAAPLAIGETFTIASDVLGETRTINVYRPPVWGDTAGLRLPVLYMPDGGIGEDFLHVAGLLQVSAMNGTMRPFLLVGIENTERRRDLTGPTRVAADSAIAPRVGGSAAFRRFIRDELMPVIDARYRTAGETGIIGESLAGLFIVETFLLEPELFDTYIAFDPSLWWDDASLLDVAGERLRGGDYAGRALYLASSGEEELANLAAGLASVLEAASPDGLAWRHRAMPDESHATIYHPAALGAVRELLGPEPECAIPSDPVRILEEGGLVQKVWTFPLEAVHLRPVLPADSAYLAYRSAIMADGADERYPSLHVPPGADSDQAGIWRDEDYNNRLAYGGDVGSIAPISCLDALLFAEQNARVPQLERPTEFLASVLKRRVRGRDEVAVVFGAGTELFPPASVHGFDIVDEYLAAGWRYWYVLHNHTRQADGALGVPVPSTSDVGFARNLAARRGLERVRVTNGFYSFDATVEAMSVFRAR